MNRAERRAAARGKTTISTVQGRRWSATKKKGKAGKRTVSSTEYEIDRKAP